MPLSWLEVVRSWAGVRDQRSGFLGGRMGRLWKWFCSFEDKARGRERPSGGSGFIFLALPSSLFLSRLPSSIPWSGVFQLPSSLWAAACKPLQYLSFHNSTLAFSLHSFIVCYSIIHYSAVHHHLYHFERWDQCLVLRFLGQEKGEWEWFGGVLRVLWTLALVYGFHHIASFSFAITSFVLV